METIEIFKAHCKKEFNHYNYFLEVGIEYNCKMIKPGYNLTRNTIIVTSDGVNQTFSTGRFYEHFYTKSELRKIKLEKLNKV